MIRQIGTLLRNGSVTRTKLAEEYLLNNSPSGMFRESYSRWLGGSSGTISSGVLNLTAIPLFAGDTVTTLTYSSGGTALTKGSTAGTPHLWAALFDTAYGLITQSTDEGDSASWTGSTAKSFTMGTPYPVTASGIYYAGLCVVAGTGGAPAQPSIRGVSMAGATSVGLVGGQKNLGGLSTTALTATAPATAATPTAPSNIYYVVAT